MAISQICKFEVKEELDHYVKQQGLSRSEAARRIAKQLTELMGEEVKSETIRNKAYRAEKVVANATTTPTPENHTESTENQTNQINQTPINKREKIAKDGTMRGGSRPGAGRKPKCDDHKPKKPLSQKMVWRKVEKMLAQLTKYMMAHCETPVDIAALCRSKIKQHIDLLNIYNNDL